MKIKDVMSGRLVAVDYNRSCGLAAKLMAENQIGSVVVRKGEAIVGIVTETDIVYRLVAEGKDPVQVTVESIMSFPIYTIEEISTVEEARKLMTENQVRHLVVVRQGKPVGVFSARNVLEFSVS